MANPGNLRLATLKIGREDTGAGGLVQLTGGKTRPILRFGDPGWQDPPVVVWVGGRDPVWGGVPRGWEVRATFQILVPETAEEGLEHTLADRLAARLTNPRYAAKGIDTSVEETGRVDQTAEGLARGLIRLDVDYVFIMSV